MTSVQTIPGIVAAARGTVVLLKTFNRRGRVIGLGSGFRIAGGRFVTNAHVVAGASRVEIFDDTGTLLGIARSADMLSTTVDLAILPPVGTHSPYLSLARTAPAVGEQIIVIGAPEGLTNTVSDGIVSAVRKIETRQLLQISAPISPGSSGGPVLNARGEVVGVSVSILREGQNLNFAVPVSDVIALVSSRPGQFEFPASTEEVSKGSPRHTGHTRSATASPTPTLSVGSAVNGQLTLDDKVPGAGYVDYFRLDGNQGRSVSIWVTSPDFEPFLGVARLVGDSMVVVATGKNYGRTANAVVTLSAGVSYLVGIGATEASDSKMGGYTVIVGNDVLPLVGAGEESRWLAGASADNFENEFDRTRITSTGSGTYIVWERNSHPTPTTSKSGETFDMMMIQYEISCGDSRYRSISSTGYLKGQVMWSSSTSAWQTAVPESVGEASGRVICSYIKAHGL